MIIPIRCFTCGKPVAQFWETYQEKTEKGESPKKVCDNFGLDRYCCRRMIVTHVDLMDDLLLYSK